MAPNDRYLLNVPTKAGLIAAGVTIVFFVVLAFILYFGVGHKHIDEFAVKVADYLLQGALVSLLFAILKATIDGTRAG